MLLHSMWPGTAVYQTAAASAMSCETIRQARKENWRLFQACENEVSMAAAGSGGSKWNCSGHSADTCSSLHTDNYVGLTLLVSAGHQCSKTHQERPHQAVETVLSPSLQLHRPAPVQAEHHRWPRRGQRCSSGSGQRWALPSRSNQLQPCCFPMLIPCNCSVAAYARVHRTCLLSPGPSHT